MSNSLAGANEGCHPYEFTEQKKVSESRFKSYGLYNVESVVPDVVLSQNFRH